MEAVIADEIHHVRFANTWLKRLADEDPREMLEVAAAISWLRVVVVATGGDPRKAVATSVESRELAGFSEADISEVARLERVVSAQIRDVSASRRSE
jgi:uncharacterized ferritin-like protein (DUF455 family)